MKGCKVPMYQQAVWLAQAGGGRTATSPSDLRRLYIRAPSLGPDSEAESFLVVPESASKRAPSRRKASQVRPSSGVRSLRAKYSETTWLAPALSQQNQALHNTWLM